MTTASTRKPRDTPAPPATAPTAHHAIDLAGLMAGDYITLNGHWYSMQKFNASGISYVAPGHEGASYSPVELDLTLVHCPWLGCPAAAEPEPVAEVESEEPFFEPGKVYLSANRAFEFTCERVIDGVAIGYEREFDPRWNPERRRAWHGVMVEGCYTEVGPGGD